MTISLKLQKSAGVPVTRAVHRLLTTANEARNNEDWSQAALYFKQALEQDPDLAHIWIQYGHALKETGGHGDAKAAYEKAATLRPLWAEPQLHLGHVHKLAGDWAKARRSYLQAARLDPASADVLQELHSLGLPQDGDERRELLEVLNQISHSSQNSRGKIATAVERARSSIEELATVFRQKGLEGRAIALEALVAEAMEAETGRKAKDKPDTDPDSQAAIVFDVSDLISYFHNSRLPTGIQRVQIETIRGVLRSQRQWDVRICAFTQSRDEWVEIPQASFELISELSLTGGDRTAPDWVAAVARLEFILNLEEPLVFPTGAFLINLGTSWWMHNYFLNVRQLKKQRSVRYVPFVHDLIPIVHSTDCMKDLTREFITWVLGVFDHADFFLANSESTKRDLLKVAAQLGYTLDTNKISIIRLDADFRKPGMRPFNRSVLSKWGLANTPFVLFVSTIEPRKNHLDAFEAWTDLIMRHGPRTVPTLVCVGARGWLCEPVYARLNNDNVLRSRVLVLSGLSDAELDLLYRSCLFTLYPSRYEGWGLPVTESLCYGKPVLSSDASSLPEAGGDYAVYFESDSVPSMVEKLEKLIYDEPYRQGLERKIEQGFRPRTWQEISDEVTSAVLTRFNKEADHNGLKPPAPQGCVPGVYYCLARNFETRIWSGMRSAEIFRAGSGWWGPDDWGCWTKAECARLEIGLPDDDHKRWLLYVQLHGVPRITCHYELEIENGRVVEGIVPADGFKWHALTIDPSSDKSVNLLIRGLDHLDLTEVTGGVDRRVVSVGVSGFFLCAADDTATRHRLLEAVTFNALDELTFGREK